MRRNTTNIAKYLEILTMRRDGKTFEEISARYGVSRQRVWQIYQRARKRIYLTMTGSQRHDTYKRAA